VRVDPDYRQVLAVAAGELGERRHAHGALAPKGRDPRRVVLTDDLKGARELLEDDRLGLHAVAFLEAVLGHRDRRSHGGTVVRRQNRFEDRRAHGVATAGDVERELGGERLDDGRAGALPLGADEAEVDAVVVGGAGRRGVGMRHVRFLPLMIRLLRRPERFRPAPRRMRRSRRGLRVTRGWRYCRRLPGRGKTLVDRGGYRNV
jgi:hypothetical protein